MNKSTRKSSRRSSRNLGSSSMDTPNTFDSGNAPSTEKSMIRRAPKLLPFASSSLSDSASMDISKTFDSRNAGPSHENSIVRRAIKLLPVASSSSSDSEVDTYDFPSVNTMDDQLINRVIKHLPLHVSEDDSDASDVQTDLKVQTRRVPERDYTKKLQKLQRDIYQAGLQIPVTTRSASSSPGKRQLDSIDGETASASKAPRLSNKEKSKIKSSKIESASNISVRRSPRKKLVQNKAADSEDSDSSGFNLSPNIYARRTSPRKPQTDLSKKKSLLKSQTFETSLRISPKKSTTFDHKSPASASRTSPRKTPQWKSTTFDHKSSASRTSPRKTPQWKSNTFDHKSPASRTSPRKTPQWKSTTFDHKSPASRTSPRKTPQWKSTTFDHKSPASRTSPRKTPQWKSPRESTTFDHKSPASRTSPRKTPQWKSTTFDHKSPASRTSPRKTPQWKSPRESTTFDHKSLASRTSPRKTPQWKSPGKSTTFDHKSPAFRTSPRKTPQGKSPRKSSTFVKSPATETSQRKTPQRKSPRKSTTFVKSPATRTSPRKTPQSKSPSPSTSARKSLKFNTFVKKTNEESVDSDSSQDFNLSNEVDDLLLHLETSDTETPIASPAKLKPPTSSPRKTPQSKPPKWSIVKGTFTLERRDKSFQTSNQEDEEQSLPSRNTSPSKQLPKSGEEITPKPKRSWSIGRDIDVEPSEDIDSSGTKKYNSSERLSQRMKLKMPSTSIRLSNIFSADATTSFNINVEPSPSKSATKKIAPSLKISSFSHKHEEIVPLFHSMRFTESQSSSSAHKGHEAEAAHSNDEESEAAHSIDEEPEAGHSIDEEPEAAHSIDEEPEAGHSIDEEPEAAHSIDEEPEAGHSSDEEPEAGHSIDEEPEAGHSSDEEPEAGHSSDEEPEAAHSRDEEREDMEIANTELILLDQNEDDLGDLRNEEAGISKSGTKNINIAKPGDKTVDNVSSDDETGDASESSDENEEDDNNKSYELQARSSTKKASPKSSTPRRRSVLKGKPNKKKPPVKKRKNANNEKPDMKPLHQWAKRTFKRLTGMRQSKEVLGLVGPSVEKFIDQVMDDVSAYADHAGRDTIEKEDFLLYFKRVGAINEAVGFTDLALEYLPSSAFFKVVPCAGAYNVIKE